MPSARTPAAPNSQTLANLLGKMLRLNADGGIPADNPFFDARHSGKNRAIWALGLRNPFTFAFEPGSGRMFINDVGQSTWEEINDGLEGANYGWPSTEGETVNPDFESPLFVYAHGSGQSTGCAITGGAFFDPAASWPAEFDGDYFYADFCTGWIRRYHPSSDTAGSFATSIASPVDLSFRPEGLYYLARGGGPTSGAIHRIVYTAQQAPQITSEPQDQTATAGRPATFNVGASGAAPLAFQWQKNRTDIAGATGTSYTLASAQLSDDGALFRCVVTNGAGGAQSREAELTVTPNQPPVATITEPPGGLYRAGEGIDYEGKGNDPEDGKLPASAFTWQVDFHHDDHNHPFVQPTSGSRRGSFTIPRTGETSPNVFYRIRLTVVDSAGRPGTTFVDLHPETSTVRIETIPSGLVVNVDGQPATTPVQFVAVVGMKRAIEAVTPQALAGVTYAFKSWSDDKPAAHEVKIKADDKTYTARYKARQ